MDATESMDEFMNSVRKRDLQDRRPRKVEWIGSEDYSDASPSVHSVHRPQVPELRNPHRKASIELDEDTLTQTLNSVHLSQRPWRADNADQLVSHSEGDDTLNAFSADEELLPHTSSRAVKITHRLKSWSAVSSDCVPVPGGREDSKNDDQDPQFTPSTTPVINGHKQLPKRVKARRAPGGRNQDYMALARLYKIQRPYGDPNCQVLCLLCNRNFCEDVFFPCEHHCVCRSCLVTENFCEEEQLRKNPKGHSQCSLCAGIIKKIFPLDRGAEVKKYWDWVYEEQIPLPIGFKRNWRHSEAIIKKIYVEEKKTLSEQSPDVASNFCAIS